MTWRADLQELVIRRNDDVAIALSDQLSPSVAADAAQLISRRLDEAAVPRSQRTWIIATRDNDQAAATIAAAVSDHVAGAQMVIHNSREPDEVTFQRRVPGQRRGGIYLNHAWQAASVRIGVGEAMDLLSGLSAWFNQRDRLRVDDLAVSLLIH